MADFSNSFFKARHFRVAELAALWRMGCDKIRRMFRNEPGVLRIRNNRRGTRIYETLLIPEPVAERVYRRYVNGG